MSVEEALVANMLADHIQVLIGGNPNDARLVATKDWPELKKKAKKYIIENAETFQEDLESFYSIPFDEMRSYW